MAMFPDTTEILTQRRSVQFDAARGNQGSALYVQPEDRLQLSVWCSQAGFTLSLTGRFMLPSGEIKAIRQDVQPLASPAPQSFKVGLPEGWLLGVSVTCISGTLRRGQVFLAAGLVRGEDSNTTISQVLFSDYLGPSQPIGWPGGFIRQSTEGPGYICTWGLVNPAAGASPAWGSSTYGRMRVCSIYARLVCSAVVANRVPVAIVYDGAQYVGRYPMTTAITAGQTVYCTWAPGAQAVSAGGAQVAALANPLTLAYGSTVAVLTTGIDAGDQWDNCALVIEQLLEK